MAIKHAFEIAELFTDCGKRQQINLSRKQADWLLGVKNREHWQDGFHCFEFGGVVSLYHDEKPYKFEIVERRARKSCGSYGVRAGTGIYFLRVLTNQTEEV